NSEVPCAVLQFCTGTLPPKCPLEALLGGKSGTKFPVLVVLGNSAERSSTVQCATNILSNKALELIAAGRTFPPVGPISVMRLAWGPDGGPASPAGERGPQAPPGVWGGRCAAPGGRRCHTGIVEQAPEHRVGPGLVQRASLRAPPRRQADP